MAIQLFRLVIESQISETQYFQEASVAYTITTAVTSIDATDFWNGDGTAVTAFTPATTNGYYTLEIAGVLQQSGLYTVSSTALEMNLAAGDTSTYSIAVGAPIVLSVTEPSVTS